MLSLKPEWPKLLWVLQTLRWFNKHSKRELVRTEVPAQFLEPIGKRVACTDSSCPCASGMHFSMGKRASQAVKMILKLKPEWNTWISVAVGKWAQNYLLQVLVEPEVEMRDAVLRTGKDDSVCPGLPRTAWIPCCLLHLQDFEEGVLGNHALERPPNRIGETSCSSCHHRWTQANSHRLFSLPAILEEQIPTTGDPEETKAIVCRTSVYLSKSIELPSIADINIICRLVKNNTLILVY